MANDPSELVLVERDCYLVIGLPGTWQKFVADRRRECSQRLLARRTFPSDLIALGVVRVVGVSSGWDPASGQVLRGSWGIANACVVHSPLDSCDDT